MSYSFGVRGATKAAVMEKLAVEFDKVVAGQAIHSVDRSQAQDAAEAFLGVLPQSDGDQDIFMSVSGFVGWKADNVIISTGVNVSVSFVAKEKA